MWCLLIDQVSGEALSDLGRERIFFIWGAASLCSQVPYVDDDFELFFDVSGSSHFYKEFEMSALNGTYDVLWRATDPQTPGQGGVPCNPRAHLSWCSNSTDHSAGFSGEWTMMPALSAAARITTSGGERFGDDFPFTPWSVPQPKWTAEARLVEGMWALP